MNAPLRVHDLLRLDAQQVAELSHAATAQSYDWVAYALIDAPWVVMCRATIEPGAILVGVRGTERNRRWAGPLKGEPLEILHPQALPAERAPRPQLAPVRALRLVQEGVATSLPEGRATIGPGGSCAFELATGHPTLTDTSDLDLIITADEPLTPDEVATLARLVEICAGEAGCRIDTLVETPRGAVHLNELASPHAGMVLRTAHGPELTSSPWGFEKDH